MALITKNIPTENVVLKLEQDGYDVNLWADTGSEKILIAFFNTEGILQRCYISSSEIDSFKDNLKFKGNYIQVN